jgi:hypothetical protein
VLHRSFSEPRRHITARGFVNNRGAFTLHADGKGRCLDFYKGTGKFKTLDIEGECDRL